MPDWEMPDARLYGMARMALIGTQMTRIWRIFADY